MAARLPTDSPTVTRIEGTGEFFNRDVASRGTATVTDGGNVILNFAGANIQDVVRTVLGTTLKLNYVMHPKVTGKVTVQTSRPLSRDAVLPTLESILRLHGVVLVKSGNVYKVLPVSEAPAGSIRPRLGASPRRSGGAFGVQIVPLAFVSANEMERILKPFAPAGGILRVDSVRNLLMLAGTRGELANLLEIVEIFDVDWLAGRSVALFPLQTAEAKSVIKDLEQVFGADADGPLAGLVRFVAIERLNAILTISARSDYLDRAEEWIERFDTGLESGDRKLHVYHVQNSRANDLADILNRIFGDRDDAAKSGSGPARRVAASTTAQPVAPASTPAVTTPAGQAARTTAPPARAATARATAPATPDDGAASTGAKALRIIADEKNNALVILATPREYRAVLAAVRKLDIAPLQVLIEATIAEVRLNDTLRYGLQWFFKRGGSTFSLSNLASGAVASTFPGFSYAFADRDINVVLDALTSITDVNVISSPQIMVLDNQTATLQVGDQVPVSTQQTVDVTNVNSQINTIQFRDTGVILEVTPRVNASGLVQMDISQEVSDVTATTSSTLNSPTIQQRKIKSTVAVQSGETIALGGMIKDRKSKSKSGVPLLSDIPILGALFSTTTDTDTRTELLVLITPRVVRNQAEARRVTDELRSRLRALGPLDKRIQ